jgi:hypothetical protein
MLHPQGIEARHTLIDAEEQGGTNFIWVVPEEQASKLLIITACCLLSMQRNNPFLTYPLHRVSVRSILPRNCYL